MNPVPFVSRAALAAGLPPRFHYWRGHSGRSHLFTCAERPGIGDFGEAVVIAVVGDDVVWAGSAEALAGWPASAQFADATLHVHLLAGTAEERRAVIDDLRPRTGPLLRLAA